MPSYSEKQRKFFGAEVGRRRAGKQTKTTLSTNHLRAFAGEVKTRGNRSMRSFHA